MDRTTQLVTVLYAAIVLLAQLATCQDKGKLDDLNCPPCERIHCKPKKANRLIRNKVCKGSITTGICDCCPVCAKVAGESCGGKWGSSGKCDAGLECVKPVNPNIQPAYYNPQVGVCRPRTDIVSDDPSLCKPKCTPEFCQKNPRAICSAIDNHDQKQECQGHCQHTSCRACRIVESTADCPKCAKDDDDCLAKFGRCVKQNICARDKFPCMRNEMVKTGNFRCMVPECVYP
ncbi:cysteine-rich motor neuron 1 protein-like [Glandiceps talaboti]